MPDLYIIGGCNGAGKTTASTTILPEILKCREFVNADNIAAGISPFNPENVAFEAGRIMLQRINHLIESSVSFAFETTLATRSYVSLIKKARLYNYKVNLLYFWLKSPEFAIQRVAKRVENGGHNIPPEIIVRRYYRGIANMLNLYIPIVDNWSVVDNFDSEPNMIAEGSQGNQKLIIYPELWSVFIEQGINGK